MGKLVFKLSASSAGKIMGGKIGLTDTQEEKLKELKSRDEAYQKSRDKANMLQKLKNEIIPSYKEEAKFLKVNLKNKDITQEEYEEKEASRASSLSKSVSEAEALTQELKGISPLTPNMEAEMQSLLQRKLNPELPQGAKTFLKKWIKQKLFKRREQFKSKYTDKGNLTEEEGFTLMCVELGLGMVYKNEEFKENDFFRGICDLDLGEVDDEIIDNKSSYSLDTFPMFESELDNEDYEYQCLVYTDLYKRSNARLVYTLNDTPMDILRAELKWIFDEDEKQNVALNLVFTRKYWDEVKAELFPMAKEIEFVEIPAELRVKSFVIEKKEGVIQDMKQRVILSQKYIDEILEKYEL